MRLTAANRSRFSWLSVCVGILVLVGGCIFSVTLRNPGGPPVPAREAESAKQLAYNAICIGAAIAVGIPLLLSVLEWKGGSKQHHRTNDENE